FPLFDNRDEPQESGTTRHDLERDTNRTATHRGGVMRGATPMMRGLYREILAHASVYALGLVLARVTSILLLPVYTRYLTPTDYGVIALLDLIGALLGQVTASGQVTAAGRYHFAREDERYRDTLWWTTLTQVCVGGLV